jgi:superfamily I DNA/RNA helicase
LASQIAKLLLGTIEESQNVVRELTRTTRDSTPTPETEGIFGRMIKGLLRGVLALVTPAEPEAISQQEKKPARIAQFESEHAEVDVSISMTELITGCGEISVDDLFLGLFELSKAGALTLRKRFSVLKNGVPSGEEYWSLLQTAVERLLTPTEGAVDLLDRKQLEAELKQWYASFLTASDAHDDEGDSEPDVTSRPMKRRIQREVYRAISTSLRILRYAGIELQETISDTGDAQYTRSIPESIRSQLVRSCDESIPLMQKLLACVAKHEPQPARSSGEAIEVLLTDLMTDLGPEIRVGRLKELMKLLETSGFYGFDGALNEWVSLVSLNTQDSLEPHNPDATGQSRVQVVYTEMLEKYELQVLRAQAMILLAAMPPENRKQYIDRYFECVRAEDLKSLLEDTVGEVDDEVIASNSMLQELLSQVRKERFVEEVDRLNDNQRDVCSAPFDRTLLVNAGPGAGKTHVLMMRCAHLIHVQRIAPAEILVLAFNRAVVYEIRDRIRTLFRALGYGSYANRLDVSTFHSFALRHQVANDLYEEDAIGQAVHLFAEQMQDEDFAQTIGGKYKTILVDEFQDMNEDFYSVVSSLFTHCAGGGMVIGDDDQDILSWNRRQWRSKYRMECPLDAVHYFSDFRDALEPDEHSLKLNYRSVPEIVDRAEGMIEKVSAKVGFTRMKGDIALEAFREEHGSVELPLDPTTCTELVRDTLGRDESVAVLCRSNRECRQVYETLVGPGNFAREHVNLLGAEDFGLYHLRHSGALLDICQLRPDYEFVEAYIWEELLEEYDKRALAEHEDGRDYLGILYTLVREEVGRPRIRDLVAFIQEMRGSDVERLKAKSGLSDGVAKITVATVHKVKGLEYDTVLVMPSKENFPFRNVSGGISEPEINDSAEEARLCYVAMTRARNRLYVGWDLREKRWLARANYETDQAAHRYCLKGSPKELFVSWAGQEEQVKHGLQEYIGSQVCIGDPLTIHGSGLRHDGQTVGRLSNRTRNQLQQAAANAQQLRVSNVVRYTCGRYFREKKPEFWGPLDNSVKRQGWFYIVLAEQT